MPPATRPMTTATPAIAATAVQNVIQDQRRRRTGALGDRRPIRTRPAPVVEVAVLSGLSSGSPPAPGAVDSSGLPAICRLYVSRSRGPRPTPRLRGGRLIGR